MSIYESSDLYILKDLGERIKVTRLNKNMTQEHLATITGVSRNCIQALEQGTRGISLLNFIQVLRGLKVLEHIDLMLPMPFLSPMQLAKMQGKQRKRARE